MFVELKELLAQSQSITLIMSANGDAITVTVLPKMADTKSDPALSIPQQLTGTAEELDAGFAGAIGKFTEARKSLLEQVDATNTILEAAKKAQAEKAVKPAKSATKGSGSSPVKSKSATADKDDEDDDELPGMESSSTTSTSDQAESSSGESTTDTMTGNLFA